jgi:hypothetical protein
MSMSVMPVSVCQALTHWSWDRGFESSIGLAQVENDIGKICLLSLVIGEHLLNKSVFWFRWPLPYLLPFVYIFIQYSRYHWKGITVNNATKVYLKQKCLFYSAKKCIFNTADGFNLSSFKWQNFCLNFFNLFYRCRGALYMLIFVLHKEAHFQYDFKSLTRFQWKKCFW